MARSTRLYTLCVIFLLAYQPPATLAASTSRLERVSIAQLERRQGLEGIFGGRGSAGDTTTDTTADTTSPVVTGTTGGTVNPTQATSALSSTALSSTTGIRIPLLGTSTASSTSTEPVGVSLSLAISASSETSATSEPNPASSSAETSSVATVSQIIVTVTSIVTNADGSQSTMVSASASAVAKNDDGGSGPSGKTWGIIGGVVGGVAVLIGAILVVWRCTQRRFDNLDGDVDEIKWPELQPDGQTVSAGLSTLNPAATRRTGGAGFEMEKDDASEWGDESPRLGMRPGANETQYFDQPYEYSGNAGVGNGNNGGGSQRGSYYDPYLGQTASPYPSPPNVAYPPSSPYGQYAGAISNNSFHDSRIYESTDDVPLTQHQQHPHFESAGNYPIVRVSSPASQHRM